MSEPDFVFSVRLAGREPFDDVLGDLAATVLGQIGCSMPDVTVLVAQLSAAVRSRADGESEFDVQFRAHAGSCEVVVSVRDREIWRSSASSGR